MLCAIFNSLLRIREFGKFTKYSECFVVKTSVFKYIDSCNGKQTFGSAVQFRFIHHLQAAFPVYDTTDFICLEMFSC